MKESKYFIKCPKKIGVSFNKIGVDDQVKKKLNIFSENIIFRKKIFSNIFFSK